MENPFYKAEYDNVQPLKEDFDNKELHDADSGVMLYSNRSPT